MNRDLEESTRATALARSLEGRSMQLSIGAIMDLHAAILGARLSLTSGVAAADAQISGPLFALLGLFNETAASPASAASVQVRGDADIASRFRELFKLLRPDLETQTARLIGELPARGLARFSAAALDWGRRAIDSGRRNVAEYLVEESRDLVNKTELDEFLRGADLAREAADRVEARLALLERRRGAGS